MGMLAYVCNLHTYLSRQACSADMILQAREEAVAAATAESDSKAAKMSELEAQFKRIQAEVDGQHQRDLQQQLASLTGGPCVS